jgi:uncharacterized protein YndB with AHSA1/START domain
MPDGKNSIAGRELRFSRMLDAPIELVWEVWESPAHIKLWWGPDGFTNTITKMDFKPCGEWDMVMHGPDGTNYEIKIVFKEIVKHKKIVYEQLANFKCIATIEFESQKNKTSINWQMLFESEEYLKQAAKTYKVDEGLEQTAERFINYLSHSIIS